APIIGPTRKLKNPPPVVEVSIPWVCIPQILAAIVPLEITRPSEFIQSGKPSGFMRGLCDEMCYSQIVVDFVFRKYLIHCRSQRANDFMLAANGNGLEHFLGDFRHGNSLRTLAYRLLALSATNGHKLFPVIQPAAK